MSSGVLNLLYETSPWHTRCALFDGHNKLLSLRFDEPKRPYIEEAVVYGRVRKIAQGLAAAFVDIGDMEDGFLPLKTVPTTLPKLTEGSAILVRITRAATEGKGAKLDARVAHKPPKTGTKAPALLAHAPKAISRILVEANDKQVHFWVSNAMSEEKLHGHIPEAADRIHRLDTPTAPPLLDALDTQLDDLFSPEYPLDNGGKLTIESTAALTAIDLDSGAFYGLDKEDTVVSFNHQAVSEVVRLIKLLDIGGNIIIDFITMKHKKDRTAITEALKQAFQKTDERRVEVFPMSRFGLVEINREKTGLSRSALLSQPMFVAGRIALTLLRKSTPYRTPIHLKTTPEVAHFIKEMFPTDVALSHFSQPLHCVPEASLSPTQWHLST